MATTILGISAFYHDSAAALVRDGEIVAAAQEERFTRVKHDSSFPRNAVSYCLAAAGVTLKQLDAVAFYDKPFLKFERLIETYYAFAPKGAVSFRTGIPVWIKEKLMLDSLILNELGRIETIDKKSIRLLFTEHHLSHAASAFYPSPFEESAIITADGVGEWATASICRGHGNKITILKELKFPHSIGLLYSAFTFYLGFKVNSGEYKVMGLSPYGNSQSAQVKRFVETIKREIARVKEDGSLWLNQELFDYCTGLCMVKPKKWEALFGFPRRLPESEIRQEHCDLARAVQDVTEEIVLKMAQYARKLTESRHLTLAGGVALNCAVNGRLLQTGLFDDIWIQPAAGDAGGALGAAYGAYHIFFDRPRSTNGKKDAMKGSYLGPSFSDNDIAQTINKHGAAAQLCGDDDILCAKTAELIAEGKVVGWFQGRMEWGPRALGSRSILADARNTGMQKKLNIKIKYRESFRPFAPSVLSEDAGHYFDLKNPSPYMLFTYGVAQQRRKPLPPDYDSLTLTDKLQTPRSDIPAVTHIDFSARAQTVDNTANPLFYRLLRKFKDKTQCGILINTSFNVRGEPIACSPEDAYRCFMRTEMDYLIMGRYILDKAQQKNASSREDWGTAYEID